MHSLSSAHYTALKLPKIRHWGVLATLGVSGDKINQIY